MVSYSCGNMPLTDSISNYHYSDNTFLFIIVHTTLTFSVLFQVLLPIVVHRAVGAESFLILMYQALL
jgi:hypothetical protein